MSGAVVSGAVVSAAVVSTDSVVSVGAVVSTPAVSPLVVSDAAVVSVVASGAAQRSAGSVSPVVAPLVTSGAELPVVVADVASVDASVAGAESGATLSALSSSSPRTRRGRGRRPPATPPSARVGRGWERDERLRMAVTLPNPDRFGHVSFTWRR